jgi:dienelactone hydrolase
MLTLLLGCGPSPESKTPLVLPREPNATRAPSVDVQSLGEQVVRALAAGEHAAVASRFDSAMADAMTAEQLGELWAGVENQVGRYQGIAGVRLSEDQGFAIATVTTSFEKAKLDIRVVLDPDQRITGLFVKPSTQHEGYETPAYVDRAAFEEEPIELGAPPWRLPGTLTRPKDASKCPGLVLVHGSGPNDRDESVGPNKPFRDIALGLASRGICVLRYDKRTLVHGKALMKAVGNELTLVEETIDDAVAAAELLRARPEVDPARVFVLGHSLGGTAIPRIAARSPALAGFVILAGSSRPMEDAVLNQLSYIANLDGVLSDQERALLERMEGEVARVKALSTSQEPAVGELPLGIAAPYWRDLAAHPPAPAIAEESRPVFVLHGGRDYQVTDVDYEGWRRALDGKPNATLTRYPDLNHLMVAGTGKSAPPEYLQPGHVAPQVVADLATWIGSH